MNRKYKDANTSKLSVPEMDSAYPDNRVFHEVKNLLALFSRKVLDVLPMLTVAAAVGCSERSCKSEEPITAKSAQPKESLTGTPSEQPPSEADIREAQEEIMNLLRRFMKNEVAVEVPEKVKLHLSRTQEDYIKAGSDSKRALGLHSMGFHSKGEIWIDAQYSKELIRLTSVGEDAQTESISCDTVDASAILIHEVAHALTKDKTANNQGPYHFFTNAMHEALASETAPLAPLFVETITGIDDAPTNCMSFPVAVTTENQRYTANKTYGAYPNQVIFESYLFTLAGTCEPGAIPWAKCSLRELMSNTFNQRGAGKYLNAILNKNRRCKSPEFRGQIDAAIMYADAPYLQYALSRCDGFGEIPDVACRSIQTIKGGDPNIMDSLVLRATYPDGKPTGWTKTLTDLENGKVYDHPNEPLGFRDRIITWKQTMPEYSSTFTYPHNPNDPCQLIFQQNYYCDNFQLNGFESNDPVYVLLRNGKKEYFKGSYEEGVTVNVPLLEGTEVYVNVGTTHLKPADLDITGKGTCVISPKE